MSKSTEGEPRTIELLRIGADQVVQIPKDMEIAATEVYVWREGGQLVISALPAHERRQSETDEMGPR